MQPAPNGIRQQAENRSPTGSNENRDHRYISLSSDMLSQSSLYGAASLLLPPTPHIQVPP